MSQEPEQTSPTPAAQAAAGRIRIVLVGTQHPGNIGAAARAMRTMGLQRLALVAPRHFPHAEAAAMAASAGQVLEQATVHADLAEAVADCRLVLGSTARDRRIALPQLAPREAAGRVVEAAGGNEVALVFGRERTGLENHELQLCHCAVHIPSDPDCSSLNLASAVQVLAYEVRLALLEAGVTMATEPRHGDDPASHAEVEGFFAQLHDTLDQIDFHKGRNPDAAMRKLRRIFLRTDLRAGEVRLLRGVLADAQRMARLAGR
ncbi:RNA methyltransferase [Luteimonas dalianensis]|uniref:RNA methyltransferase n=1 Tax=Luteimonas dalianensis TaxID=1148196 RepID=UPI003BF195A6